MLHLLTLSFPTRRSSDLVSCSFLARSPGHGQARGPPGRFAWRLRAGAAHAQPPAWFSSATTPRRTAGALLECVSGQATASACRGPGFGVARDMVSYRPLTNRAGRGADGRWLVTSLPRGPDGRSVE